MLAGVAAGVYGFDLDALTPVAARIGPKVSEVHTPLTEIPVSAARRSSSTAPSRSRPSRTRPSARREFERDPSRQDVARAAGSAAYAAPTEVSEPESVASAVPSYPL